MAASEGSPPDVDVSSPDWQTSISVHAAWLRKVILARTGQEDAVEDVFQQVALAAVEQRWPLRDPTKIAPWLHRLAVIYSARFRRALGRERRAVQRAAGSTPDAGNPPTNNLLAWLIAKERKELMRRALGGVPERDVEILILKYIERWSYRQISENLGISEKAVDSRLVRARARLRQELISVGVDEKEL